MAPRRTLDTSSDRSGHVETAPPWLQVAAGWSWRLLVLALAVGLIFVSATRIQMVLIAVFIGLVLTAVLRPVADFLAKIMPRPLATTLALLGALAVVASGRGMIFARKSATGRSTA